MPQVIINPVHTPSYRRMSHAQLILHKLVFSRSMLSWSWYPAVIADQCLTLTCFPEMVFGRLFFMGLVKMIYTWRERELSACCWAYATCMGVRWPLYTLCHDNICIIIVCICIHVRVAGVLMGTGNCALYALYNYVPSKSNRPWNSCQITRCA